MKIINYFKKLTYLVALLVAMVSCDDQLYEPAENRSLTEETDYTNSADMVLPLVGAYAEFQSRGWEDFPLIAVRGDDVNSGGLGDQQDYADTDLFNYNKDYWMYNSLWQNLYKDIFAMHSTIEQIELYRDHGANGATADQYIAEAKTLRGFLLFQLSRVWGNVYITDSSDPSALLVATLASKAEVMQHISDQMDEAILNLPDMNPNQRADIRGGVTKHTALAIKALANLELENYPAVADATGQIISSGAFALESNFYELFKIPGKLNDENILELQFSDFGQSAGDNISHLFAFYGPEGWTPAVEGAGSGWGFYEPSMKFIKMNIDNLNQ